MKKKHILVAVLVSLLSVQVCVASLNSKIKKLLSAPAQKKVEVGIQIIDASNKKCIYSLNAKKAMIPASNMKVITTATALHYLGSNYQFSTKIGLCGDDLVIIGSGDPLLGDKKTDEKYNRQQGWIFQEIATALKQKHIRSIGNIIADTTIFDDERVNPSWPEDQLNRWYACEVSGLNYYSNCVDMTVTVENQRPQVFINPATNYLTIDNQVRYTTNGNKSAVGAYRNGTTNKIIVKGQCKSEQGPFDVAIERPAGFFGILLAENLVRCGITTKGSFIEKAFDNSKPIVLLKEHKTSIADCVTRCNKDSYGLAAECLFKTFGAYHSGQKKNGSWDKGRQAVSAYLKKLGISDSEFFIDDGSGLSRNNRLSAHCLVTVLYDIYHDSRHQLFENSLSIGGVEGTASKRFRENNYKGKVFCKTGYINGVRTLCGWIKTTKGDYIFSILANHSNWQSKAVIDNIVKAVIDQADGSKTSSKH